MRPINIGARIAGDRKVDMRPKGETDCLVKDEKWHKKNSKCRRNTN